jgi:hypothetical protein
MFLVGKWLERAGPSVEPPQVVNNMGKDLNIKFFLRRWKFIWKKSFKKQRGIAVSPNFIKKGSSRVLNLWFPLSNRRDGTNRIKLDNPSNNR